VLQGGGSKDITGDIEGPSLLLILAILTQGAQGNAGNDFPQGSQFHLVA